MTAKNEIATTANGSALSLDELAGEINRHHTEAEGAYQAAIHHALEAGRLLIEAKGRCKHGEWLPWLEANFDASPRTAQGYMQIWQGRDQLEGDDLGIGTARKLLANPKCDTDVVFPEPDKSQTEALAEYPDGDRDEIWRRAVEESPMNALGRPAVSDATIERAAKQMEWERSSELERQEQKIKALWARDGGLRSGLTAEEEYLARKWEEEWDRKFQEEKAREEAEEREHELARADRIKQMRAARPEFDIEEAKDTLRWQITDKITSEVKYKFPALADDYHMIPAEKVSASWPVKYANEAAEILEDIARTLRESPETFHKYRPENPRVGNENRNPIYYEADEIEYITEEVKKKRRKKKAAPKKRTAKKKKKKVAK